MTTDDDTAAANGPRRRRAGLGARAAAWLSARTNGLGGDRGDVPGWVLVTLMTAGLVTALWFIAQPALEKVFNDSISSVTGP
jgi:hypothetical protein